MQELRWVCEDAWRAEQEFLARLADAFDDLYCTPWEGPETGLYVVADDCAVKFGVSDNVFKRAESLQNATYRQLILYAGVPATRSIEQRLHRELAEWRIRGEWFELAAPVLAVMETLLGIAQMCADMDENGFGPSAAVDSLLMLSQDIYRDMPWLVAA